MKKLAASVFVSTLILSLIALPALADDEKLEDKQAEIDGVASEALEALFSESKSAKSIYDKAVAYAVFDNIKVAFIVSGGGGVGVAVDKASGARTYMKMGTGGLGLGIGGQKYQVVFFFETEKVFTSFVEKGWKAETSAQAAAGTAGASAQATFHDGIAFYQMTDAGLMASADITGTKYWKYKKLNE